MQSECKINRKGILKESLEDTVFGVFRGTGLVHGFWGHVFEEGEPYYNISSPVVYYSAKFTTVALEIFGYYTLAKHGYYLPLAIPTITNLMSFINDHDNHITTIT